MPVVVEVAVDGGVGNGGAGGIGDGAFDLAFAGI